MRGTPGQDFLPSENLSLPGGEAERRVRGRQDAGVGGVTGSGLQSGGTCTGVVETGRVAVRFSRGGREF